MRWAWDLARRVYGLTLRLVPAGAAAGLRRLVARWAHRLPPDAAGPRRRLRVPGPADDPVVLLVAVGLSPGRLLAAREALSSLPVRPVWLVDTEEPSVLQDQVLEWLPPEAALDRAGIDAARIRSARLRVVVQRYRPRHTVVLAATGGLPDRVVLSALVAPG